jgi:general secretion pathway protein L
MRSFVDVFVTRSRHVLNWWVGEILSLFPISVRAAFLPEPNGLTLYYDEGHFRVVGGDPRQGPSRSGAPSTHAGDEAAWPVFSGLGDGALPNVATVWLPYSACLERHFAVPSAAAQDLARVVQLELERATPFKAEDVFSCYAAEPSSENRSTLSVRHFIAKREIISAVQTHLQQLAIEAGTITCLDKTGQKPLPINFLAGNRAAHPGKGRGIPALAAVGLLLLATAAATALLRTEHALSDLEARTSQARTEWQARQDSAKPLLAKRDEANAIAALKSKHVPTVLLLNELTHLLPDDVYLSDFKLAEGTVVINGLGRDTSRLIPLLESGELFTDVQLAAPVTIDPATDKERFSIRFALRSRAPAVQMPPAEEPL